MNIKKMHLVSSVIMIILLIFIGVNLLITRMPDWAVRVIGIVLMFNLALLTYLSVRIMQNNISSKKSR